ACVALQPCGFESTALPAEAAGAAELKVDAATDDVLVERDVGRRATATADRAGGVLQIDEQILDLGGPVRGERIFDAGAGGPTDWRGARERHRACARLHIGKRATAGAVEQHPIPGIAGAAAHGGEPVALGLAAYAGARAAARCAVEILPVAV